jgi:hypothetical protein
VSENFYCTGIGFIREDVMLNLRLASFDRFGCVCVGLAPFHDQLYSYVPFKLLVGELSDSGNLPFLT